MKQTNHSETQSSQNMCLHRNKIGACIFSWHIAQRSPAAVTYMRKLEKFYKHIATFCMIKLRNIMR